MAPKQGNQAYASWWRMMPGGDDFPLGASGKLATLWFDEIVLQVPREDFLEVTLDKIAEELGWSPATLQEIHHVWVPIHKYQPNYGFLSKAWETDVPALREVAENITITETKREAPELPETHPGFMHEIAWAGAGLIEAVSLWVSLNEMGSCTYLPHQREHLVLQELFSAATRTEPLDIFSEVMLHRIPDVSTYTWEEVVELRHHQFFEAFRGKISELHKRLNKGAPKPIRELLEEVSRKDMVEMLQLLRPTPKQAVVKAIASNLPMPLPINPLSLGLGVLDVIRTRTLSKKYGWLYFLFDLPGHSVTPSSS